MMLTASDPNDAPREEETPRVLFVTGPSGAGRSTAINALEDLGFETIDNLPLSLLPRLLDGPPHEVPLALGIDVRNRDFSTDRLVAMLDKLAADPSVTAETLYLDASEDVLQRRYSETRRRHPLAPSDSPSAGIAAELGLLVPIRARADTLIDTSALSPHDLRAEINRWYGRGSGSQMSILVQSFSYKRGLPRNADLVFDCRFLRNPHWEEDLRAKNGQDSAVAAYVEEDPQFSGFYTRMTEMIGFLLPAYRKEGKTSLSLALGCTGGKHRSVAVVEKLAQKLAEDGWQVSKRHREMERNGSARGGIGYAPSGQN